MIMKRIIFALTTALMLCTLAQGKNRTVTENDSLGHISLHYSFFLVYICRHMNPM